MEELWQTEFDGDERACDVHISNLRQKVERDPQKPELVVTVRGVGYKFNGERNLRSIAAFRQRTATVTPPEITEHVRSVPTTCTEEAKLDRWAGEPSAGSR